MHALVSRWPSLVAAGQVLTVCGVLLASLAYQFGFGEFPCPLCIIQRFSFLLACVGPMGILALSSSSGGNPGIQTRGFAMCIVASLLGVAASSRQVLLHIVPPDAGYGPPVLGLHLYSWALISFLCLIFSSAAGLLGIRDGAQPLPPVVARGIGLLIVTIGTVIMLATFTMEGFHFLLPDNPDHYELLRQLGLMK